MKQMKIKIKGKTATVNVPDSLLEETKPKYSAEEVLDLVYKAKEETAKEEIEHIKVFLNRLRKYHCGEHKKLEKQMLLRIKRLERGEAN